MPKKKYTKEYLLSKMTNCSTMWEFLDSLSLQRTGCNYNYIKFVLKREQVDHSHFKKWSPKVSKKIDLEQYLSNKQKIGSAKLRIKLIKAGIFEKKCYECNRTTWNDYDIPLELHHKDNNHNNNQLSNLMLLCPNCHACCHRKPQKPKKKTTRGLNKGHIAQRRVERPEYQTLIDQISKHGYRGTGKLYSVSDNAIRKWVKTYEKYGILETKNAEMV
jgi:5-methylcytosine-specific restriction endonuclease McrA